jgi:hypothetical protein
MKADAIVKKRFEELSNGADEILAKKEVDFTTREGKTYFNVDDAAFRGWATSALHLIQKVFGEDSIHFLNFSEHCQTSGPSDHDLLVCRGIFLAAKEDYEGGYLFNVQGLVQAEVFDDVLEQASQLLSAGYKDPACVVTGVTLETVLKELCKRVPIATGKLDRMNADLCKAGIYNIGMQKQITAWAERRNKAAHGDWGEYSADDVRDMINGVNRFIAEYL